jgi:hypothetical protein
LAFLGAGAVAFWLTLPKSSVTRENFERIRVGMTEDEVITILGQPAGRARDDSEEMLWSFGCTGYSYESLGDCDWLWVGLDDAILVEFKDRRVASKEWLAVVEHRARPLWDKVRRLLPW